MAIASTTHKIIYEHDSILQAQQAQEQFRQAGVTAASDLTKAWAGPIAQIYLLNRTIGESSRNIISATDKAVSHFNRVIERGMSSATAAVGGFTSKFIKDFVDMGKAVEGWRVGMKVALRDAEKAQQMFAYGKAAMFKTPAQIPEIMGTLKYMTVAGIPTQNKQGGYHGTGGFFDEIADTHAMFASEGISMRQTAYMVNMARQGYWRRAMRFGFNRSQFSEWAEGQGYTDMFKGGKVSGGLTGQGDLALEAFLKNRFGGGAEETMNTLMGAMSVLKDVANRFKMDMVQYEGGAYDTWKDMVIRAREAGTSWAAGGGPEKYMALINKAGVGGLQLGEQALMGAADWFGGRFKKNLRGEEPVDYAAALGITGIQGVGGLATMGLTGLTKIISGEDKSAMAEAMREVWRAGVDEMLTFLKSPELAGAINALASEIFPNLINIYAEQFATVFAARMKAGITMATEAPLATLFVLGKKMLASMGGFTAGGYAGYKMFGKAGVIPGALAGGIGVPALMAAPQIGKSMGMFQHGGPIGGTGEIPIIAHGGEFMMNATATKKWLPILKAMNAQSLADGGIVGKIWGGMGGVKLTRDPGSALNRLATRREIYYNELFTPEYPYETPSVDSFRLGGMRPGDASKIMHASWLKKMMLRMRVNRGFFGMFPSGVMGKWGRWGKIGRGIGRAGIYHLAETGIRAGGAATWAGATAEGRRRYYEQYADQGYGYDMSEEWGDFLAAPFAKPYQTFVARNIMADEGDVRSWGMGDFIAAAGGRAWGGHETYGNFGGWMRRASGSATQMQELTRYRGSQLADVVIRQEQEFARRRHIRDTEGDDFVRVPGGLPLGGEVGAGMGVDTSAGVNHAIKRIKSDMAAIFGTPGVARAGEGRVITGGPYSRVYDPTASLNAARQPVHSEVNDISWVGY
ncbi:MAG: hypothetical protein JRI80_00140 [Deltaproteobacteria bacterium]|nr:hypothetical protein [Deltaproteobacteria bacterium]